MGIDPRQRAKKEGRETRSHFYIFKEERGVFLGARMAVKRREKKSRETSLLFASQRKGKREKKDPHVVQHTMRLNPPASETEKRDISEKDSVSFSRKRGPAVAPGVSTPQGRRKKEESVLPTTFTIFHMVPGGERGKEGRVSRMCRIKIAAGLRLGEKGKEGGRHSRFCSSFPPSRMGKERERKEEGRRPVRALRAVHMVKERGEAGQTAEGIPSAKEGEGKVSIRESGWKCGESRRSLQERMEKREGGSACIRASPSLLFLTLGRGERGGGEEGRSPCSIVTGKGAMARGRRKEEKATSFSTFIRRREKSCLELSPLGYSKTRRPQRKGKLDPHSSLPAGGIGRGKKDW